jgi:hypothetical protein
VKGLCWVREVSVEVGDFVFEGLEYEAVGALCRCAVCGVERCWDGSVEDVG